MSTLFTSVLDEETDLALELTGEGQNLERDLLKLEFTLSPSEGGSCQEGPSADSEKVTSGKSPLRAIIHVSSKHLTFAGKFFRVQKQWRDSLYQTEQPIRFSEPLVYTFALLMNILHGRYRIFRQQYLDFSGLYDMCKLLEFYQISEVVSAYTEPWFQQLRSQTPIEPTSDVKQWLFVVYVLGMRKPFEYLATFIHRHYTIRSLGQIPEETQAIWIEDTLRENIRGSLSLCVESLDLLLQNYSDPKKRACTNERYQRSQCDAFNLSNLIGDLGSLGLWPLTMGTFEQYTVKQIYAKLTSIEENKYMGHESHHNGRRTECGPQKKILAIADTLWNTKGMAMPVREV